jgi:hypothetical protein
MARCDWCIFGHLGGCESFALAPRQREGRVAPPARYTREAVWLRPSASDEHEERRNSLVKTLMATKGRACRLVPRETQLNKTKRFETDFRAC